MSSKSIIHKFFIKLEQKTRYTKTSINLRHYIRKSLNKFTFNLKNKFCDAKNLKNSWNNAYMPHKLIYFSSYFFNIPQSYLCSYQVDPYNIKDDDELDFAKRKVMKIKSLCQILYYNLHGEKKKRPLH